MNALAVLGIQAGPRGSNSIAIQRWNLFVLASIPWYFYLYCGSCVSCCSQCFRGPRSRANMFTAFAFHPCWYFLLHMPGCVMFVSAFLSEYSSPLLSIPAVLCIFAGSTLRFVGFCRRYTLREAWRKRYCLWLFVATSSGDESQMQMLCCIVHTPAPLYRRNCFYYFDFCCLGWRQ